MRIFRRKGQLNELWERHKWAQRENHKRWGRMESCGRGTGAPFSNPFRAVTLIPSDWERCWLVAHSRITRSLVSALEKEPSHLELSHVPTSGSLLITCQYRVTKALTSYVILRHLQRARHTWGLRPPLRLHHGLMSPSGHSYLPCFLKVCFNFAPMSIPGKAPVSNFPSKHLFSGNPNENRNNLGVNYCIGNNESQQIPYKCNRW